MLLADATIDFLIGITTTLAVAIIALALALARTREKVVRLEEWIRLHNGKGSGQE